MATSWHVLARKDVLPGCCSWPSPLFGLWVSRNYPVGTALRMGTGYVPRLLCWLLLGLGASCWCRGCASGAAPLRAAAHRPGAPVAVGDRSASWCSACSIERLGLVLAIVLLIGIGALARARCGRWRPPSPRWC